nr:Uma2 family endonuclease [Nocardiopsis ganjiahuensis]
MTIAATKTAEHEPSHWEVVLRAWEELDLPEGWRAEIIEGDITITLLSEVAESMSIAEAEELGIPSHWEVVLRAWEELDLPEGWRAEIIEGDIKIMTPPSLEHGHIVTLIHKWLVLECHREGSGIGGAEVYQNVGVRVPLRSGLYIPDLMVLPESVLSSAPEQLIRDAILVVEVTSKSTAQKDRKPKLWGYAHAEVPLYLLVDRWDPDSAKGEVTLFSAPEDGRYTRSVRAPFGEGIELPSPFDLMIDTGAFPV